MFKAVQFDDTAQERIKQVADFERKLRLEGLLNIESEIGGIKVRQITGSDILKLDYAENRLIIGGDPDESDFLSFFLMLKSDKEKRSDLKLCKTVIKKIEDKEFVQEIYGFINYAFLDMPNTKGGSSSVVVGAKSYNASSSVWLNGVVDTMASEYGWSYDQIMEAPLARTLQIYQYLLKRILGDKYNIRNPLTSQASANEMNKLRNQNG